MNSLVSSPIAQILQSRQSRPKHRLQLLPIVTRHRKLVLHILLNLQLRHALLGLFLSRNLNIESLEMLGQIRVESSVIADVAVDVTTAFRCDRAQLDADTMTSCLEMSQCVTIAIRTSVLLSTAIDIATSQAQPEI